MKGKHRVPSEETKAEIDMSEGEGKTEKLAQKASRATNRPTLRTISELSGFAVQTVSRALSDAPDISASTKKAVRKIADEIGYVPNRAGVRLRTGKTHVISLILSTHHDVLSLTSRLISSIAEGLRSTPYHLVVTHSFPDDDPMKAVKYIVQNHTADAIIMNQILPEDPRVQYLIEQGFPFATHGRTIWADRHAYFDYDNYEFGKLGVAELAKKGRKHVLLLAPPLDQNYAIEILKGAQEAAAQSGVQLTVAQGVDSDSHRHAIRQYVSTRLTEDPSIDSLMSASPNGTMAAIAGAEDVGRRLTDTFDVFSKETVPILELFRPGILSIGEDVTKAGRFLARAAVHATEQKDETPMQELDQPGAK